MAALEQVRCRMPILLSADLKQTPARPGAIAVLGQVHCNGELPKASRLVRGVTSSLVRHARHMKDAGHDIVFNTSGG